MPSSGGWTPDTLKEYVDGMRAADLRAVDLVREYTKERLESHNNLLTKWQDATAIDRSKFASIETVAALRQALDVYKETTARALTLAEGKGAGIDAVRTGVAFVGGVIVAGVAMWGFFKGIR